MALQKHKIGRVLKKYIEIQLGILQTNKWANVHVSGFLDNSEIGWGHVSVYKGTKENVVV